MRSNSIAVTPSALPWILTGFAQVLDQDAVFLSELALGPGRAHVLDAAAVNESDVFGAEELDLNADVDRGVSAADDDDASGDGNLAEIFRLANLSDVFDGVDDARKFFARDVRVR